MKLHFIYKNKIYFETIDRTFLVPCGSIDEVKTLGIYKENEYKKSVNKYKLELIKIHKDKKVVSCKFKRRKRYIKQINYRTSHNVVRLIKY